MRRMPWWIMALMLLVLMSSTMPVRAAEPPLLVKEDEKPDPILSDEEVQKIQNLQSGGSAPILLGNISPDDQSVLTASDEAGLIFQNIQDGQLGPAMDVSKLRNVSSTSLLLHLFGIPSIAWVNNTVLQFWSVARIEDNSVPVLVSVDRTSGGVWVTPLDIPADMSPLSLAPNASRILLIKNPESADANSESMHYTQVPAATQRHNSPRLSNAQKQKLDGFLAQYPWLRVFTAGRFDEEGDATIASEPVQLWVKDLVSGELREVGSVDSKSIPVSLNWSQDGSRLGLITTRIDPGDRESATPFDGALIRSILYRDAIGDLPPAENPLFQSNQAQIFNLADRTTQTLRAPDGDGSLYIGLSWSTDGRVMAAQKWQPSKPTGHRYPSYNIQFASGSIFGFYDDKGAMIKSFQAPQVSAVQNSVQFISPDEVMFTAVNGTNMHPYYYNRVSNEFRNVADRAGSYFQLHATRFSRQIVFGYTSFTNPEDLYRLNWNGRALYRLSWGGEELRQYSQTAEHAVSFKLKSGVTRAGVLITPKDWEFPPRNRQIIVWQEGGPGIPMLNRWRANVENPYGLLPNFGYGLLVMPLAGRDGTGTQNLTALANGRNFGQVDIDEQAEIVRQMITGRWTAAGKLGITGCSYGGYFTLQSITRHPDLYSAANAQCSLVDIIVEWSRGYPALIQYLEGPRTPFNDPKEFQQDSPIYNASKIRTPLLLFKGTDDFLPITLDENLLKLVQDRKTPARMVKFESEGHGLSDEDNQLYAAQEQISWFRKYLKP